MQADALIPRQPPYKLSCRGLPPVTGHVVGRRPARLVALLPTQPRCSCYRAAPEMLLGARCTEKADM